MARTDLPLNPDFRALFEATPSPYLVLTPQLVIAAVNEAYLQATRRTREDLLGQHVFAAFPDNPDEPAASGVQNLRRSLERVLRDRTADTMAIQRYDIPVGDPAARRFELRYWSPVNTPVLGPDGRIAHIIHRVEDVTAFVQQQHRQEEAASALADQALEIQAANKRLSDSQQEALDLAQQAAAERRRLDAVLDAVPVSVLVVDAQGMLLRINAATERLWGPMPSTLGGRVVDHDWTGWWADGSARDGLPVSPAEWPLARALAGEHVRGEIIEVQTFDAAPKRRVVLSSAAPIRDARGNVAGAVVVSMDISERVRAEQALREADRRKDEFLAMLAHELRNPLAPIRSAADLLAMGRLEGERLRQTSAIVVRQVRHMTAMIDDLLDVSRVTRGLVQLDTERLDARHIVAEAAEQVRPLIDARRHRLALHTTAYAADVIGDHKRLVQVMANILANAAKYTPDGGQIDATVERAGDRVVVRVRDNGAGMTQELLARAFDLFAQAERSPDRAQGGLGIGLALVRRLVELHGGVVAAHSEGPGRGSLLVVELPAAREPAGRDPKEVEPKVPAPASRPLRILVVDDNEDAAAMLAILLQALGHQVLVEHGPASALRRVQEEPVDACLLDIGLPGMDGYQLARQLRQQPSTRSALLVAVTGYGHEQDRSRALDAGFDHHLVKPVQIAALAQLLAGQEGAGPAARAR
ncbi:MAG TPA: ATP-binding protein [Ramlibacter sp.]|jgi:signal transduction histidine kinase/ActR/RegA family two-component response regulator|uniref:PAS domain-containing hybrid sensor histidine kinase/response regulator n=1 Tax=Ramlibacter sp. TaxID=1917967 RepID=UPI002D4E3E7B|nr:ATP-binding protein [Ramlibacter sp.]HZY19477.1 ATP-binding protein [Ramlibacter sp.]